MILYRSASLPQGVLLDLGSGHMAQYKEVRAGARCVCGFTGMQQVEALATGSSGMGPRLVLAANTDQHGVFLFFFLHNLISDSDRLEFLLSCFMFYKILKIQILGNNLEKICHE